MYNKCVTCPKLGISCKGLDFKEMSAPELLEWCKLRKAHLHLSNAKLAELSGTPKGTLDRLFAGEHPDFKYETIRPVLKALTGNISADDSCPEDSTDQKDATIASLRKELEDTKERYQEYMAGNQVKLDFWTEQMAKKDELLSQRHEYLNRKDRIIRILSILLAICVVIIIAALVIDKLNSDIGFFWIDRMSNIFNSNLPNIFNRNTM